CGCWHGMRELLVRHAFTQTLTRHHELGCTERLEGCLDDERAAADGVGSIGREAGKGAAPRERPAHNLCHQVAYSLACQCVSVQPWDRIHDGGAMHLRQVA